MATLLERAINIVDKGTALPGKVASWADEAGLPGIAREADNVQDRVIKIARDLEAASKMAGEKAEDNLRQGKINAFGRDAAAWISQGNNLLWTIGGIILAVFVIRKI